MAAIRAPLAVAVRGSDAMRTSEMSMGSPRTRSVFSNRPLKPLGFAVPPERTMGSGRSVFGSFSADEMDRRRASMRLSTRSS